MLPGMSQSEVRSEGMSQIAVSHTRDRAVSGQAAQMRWTAGGCVGGLLLSWRDGFCGRQLRGGAQLELEDLEVG